MKIQEWTQICSLFQCTNTTYQHLAVWVLLNPDRWCIGTTYQPFSTVSWGGLAWYTDQATRPLCARGAFASLGAGPVCASFSRAVRPAVRTKQQPEGLREISANMAAKVLTGNSMSSWLCRLLRICLDRGMCFWVENPALSFLWDQPCWRSLIEEYKLGFFTTDYCRWGTPWRKTDEVSDISRTRLRRSLLSCGRTSGFLCRGRPSCIICRSRTSGLLGWFPW